MSWWETILSESRSSLEEEDVDDDLLPQNPKRLCYTNPLTSLTEWLPNLADESVEQEQKPTPSCADSCAPEQLQPAPKAPATLPMPNPRKLNRPNNTLSVQPSPVPSAVSVTTIGEVVPEVSDTKTQTGLASVSQHTKIYMVCLSCRVSQNFLVTKDECLECKKYVRGALECARCRDIRCMPCIENLIASPRCATLEERLYSGRGCAVCKCALWTTSFRAHWNTTKHQKNIESSTLPSKYCSLMCRQKEQHGQFWVTRLAHQTAHVKLEAPVKGVCVYCGGLVDRQ